MNFRDRLQRKAIKTKDPFIWDQFRIVKNQVNWEINSAKKLIIWGSKKNMESNQ